MSPRPRPAGPAGAGSPGRSEPAASGPPPARERRAGGIAALLVEDEEGLARVLPAWWALWSRCPNATPFQSPAWLLPWWRAFRPGRLFTAAVFEHGRLAALHPAYIEAGAWGRRVLTMGIGGTDYLDALVDPLAGEAVGRALVGAVLDRSDRWDVWSLEELRPEASALALPLGGACEERAAQSACPVLGLPRSSEDLRALAPARTARKAWNRLARRGEARIVAATADTLDETMAHLVRLHGLRRRSRGEEGALADPVSVGFHREAARQLLGAGMLRLTRLELEGRVIGAYHGLADRGRAYGFLSGFDPAYAFESPGTVLLAHTLAQAVGEGCTEFHFLRGREAYKYAWGAVDRWNRRRSIRPLPGAQAGRGESGAGPWAGGPA